VIAFEPMTAPANALVTAGPELTLLAPGESYRADAALALEAAVAEAPRVTPWTGD